MFMITIFKILQYTLDFNSRIKSPPNRLWFWKITCTKINDKHLGSENSTKILLIYKCHAFILCNIL